MSELKEIRALCDGATPGPWKAEADQVWSSVKPSPATGFRMYKVCNMAHNTRLGKDRWGKADAQFIAAAKTIIPELLDRIETAEDALRWAKNKFAEVGQHNYMEAVAKVIPND